jgi:hypothetical protein
VKYLLLICVDERLAGRLRSPAESSADAWVAEMDGRGVREQGHELRPPREARTVRRRGQEVSVTDGPFAETKESVAGFDIIECADMDEAVEIASKHPVARFGAVEVRAFA